MIISDTQLFPKLTSYIDGLIQEAEVIPNERKVQLNKLAHYIRQKRDEGVPAALNFICTHNSRRSHISQIWAATAAHYFQLDFVATYSGGTEATAFNPRAVRAMEHAGFRVEHASGDNPHYQVSFAKNVPALECFSKTYDDPVNPHKDFAAIMTCSDADENCPFIPGVEMRLPLTYDDPKAADGTAQETERYDERVRQIGRELFYAMKMVV